MKRILGLWLLLVCWGWSQPPLRVVATGHSPFLVQVNQKGADGICPAYWQACATLLKRSSQYQDSGDAEAALTRVRTGQADVAIGPIPITRANIGQVDFSLPYQVVNVAALSRMRDATLYDRLHPLLSSAFFFGGVAVLVVLLLVGLLIWLLERGRNPEQFPREPRAGLEEGVWFALTTAFTVGYGDRFPVTRAGRTLTGLWMLFAGIAFSTATALLATALTLSHIPSVPAHNVHDLMGKRLALIRGDLAQEGLGHLEASVYLADDIDQAIHWLRQGRVQVVVSSAVALNYHLRTQKLEQEFKLQELPGRAQLLSFAVAKNSPLLEPINRALLTLQESGKLRHFSDDWINQLDPEAL